jgi:S-adenosylmethionine synthetase
MKLYKNKRSSEIVELVGLGHGDYVCRWLGDEFKEMFFTIPERTFLDFYEIIKELK